MGNRNFQFLVKQIVAQMSHKLTTKFEPSLLIFPFRYEHELHNSHTVQIYHVSFDVEGEGYMTASIKVGEGVFV